MKILHTLPSSNLVEDILELGEHCQTQEATKKVVNALVKKIAEAMETDVCSIYLLDSPSHEIILWATYGLNSSAVGKVRMKVGEGLVGKTLEWLKPVSMASGRRSKMFKYFPETGEEKFHSFLSVPLMEKRKPIGVMVVQNQKATRFSTRSAQLLLTLAIPAVSVIEKVKLQRSLGQIESRNQIVITDRRRQGLMLKGIGASPGIAIGKLKIVHRLPAPLLSPDQPILDIPTEKQKALESFQAVEKEISETQKKASIKFGIEEAAIFDAYRMVLEGDAFKEQVLSEIETGKGALKSIESVIHRYTEELCKADDDYIRERAYDIQDIGRKMSDHLLHGSHSVQHNPSDSDEPMIYFSDFWSISDFVEMNIDKTLGILSPTGGGSSHIAILAESLSVPAVLGLSSSVKSFCDGDVVILDGSSGLVIVNPDDQMLATYTQESQSNEQAQVKYRQMANKKVSPIGGKKITIGANMGMLAHVRMGLEEGAEEIGLYRTEFPFLIRRSLPTEEEQYGLYKKVVESLDNRPITIRTLDIGGDKYLPYLNLPHEANPFLGWRSIRIFLEREDLFRIQLRAILRASAHGKVRLLFPMISALEEIVRVKEIVSDVKKGLRKEGYAIAADIPLGVMIEVPSAAEIARFLIKEVQFFCLGTNDLVQYTLAVDRNNAKVAHLYNPFHPAVLSLIKKTVDAAAKEKKMVSVCGEMAGQPLGILLLLGMGVTHLSMSAPLISKMKSFISRLRFSEIKTLTSEVLQMGSATIITKKVKQYFKEAKLEEFLPREL